MFVIDISPCVYWPYQNYQSISFLLFQIYFSDDSNDEKNDLSTTMTDVSTAMERRIKTLQKNCKLIRNNLNSKSVFGFKILQVLKVDQYRFCKVPKCGCTYWLQVFLVMKKTIKPDVLSNLDREELHFRLQDSIISYDYIPEVTDLMIMITRDPWKRLYSAYIDKIYRGQSNFVHLYKEMTSGSNSSECYTIPTFQEFLDYIIRISAEGRELDMHWQPVSDMCKVCSNKYRYIVKQEAFVKESAYILENILQRSPDMKDALISMLTEKFAENSLLQLGRQFVSEMSASQCQNFKDKIKRLWVSFQSQGLINDKIKFDIGLFENLSEQNGKEILNIFMTRGTSLELSNNERTLQRHTHLVNAYKNIRRKTLVNIQDVYHNDFLLFGYKKTPPS